MDNIEFLADYGDKTKTVKIVQPHLSGDQYQVLIDKGCQGMIMKIRGQWVAYWNQRSDLGADDADIQAEIIEEGLNHHFNSTNK
jgi:hypothetical protein